MSSVASDRRAGPVPTTRGRRLHAYLLAIGLAALIPGIVASSLALWWVGSTFRDNALERLTMSSRTLASGVELELDRIAQTLMPLALEATRADTGAAGSLSVSRSGARLGGRLDHLKVVDGEPEPPPHPVGLDSAQIRAAVRTGSPRFSNLFDDENGQLRVSVVIPTHDPARAGPLANGAGAASGAMIYTAGPQALIRLPHDIGSQSSEVLIAVTDGTGRLIARSRMAEKFVGRKVPDWAALKAHGGDQGLFEARTTEGRRVNLAFQTLAGTPGWVLVLGEPMHRFESTWQRPVIGLAVGSLIAILIAIIAAARIGRRILGPVQALTRHGASVARQDDNLAPIPPSPILEFEQLRQNFEAAERALRERADANRQIAERLASSERRYRAIAETGAMVLWRTDTHARLKSITGWSELTGLPDTEALGIGWFRHVHPDDQKWIAAAWEAMIHESRILDIEFRIRGADGTWRWVRARGVTTVADDGQTPECVGVLEDIDARRCAQERVAHLAHHDPLTGLANRLLLRERLDEAIRLAARGRGSALLCLDLDRFKQVNDTLGHAIGDRLLLAVANRLRATVRDVDIVARLGGDEFAIIQCDGAQPVAAAALARRLLEAICKPYDLDGQLVTIGTSVGIATIADGGTGADVLLRSADLALYWAKEDGRGCHRFFEPEMDARMQLRYRLEADLRRGVAASEFEVWYQPLHDLHDGTVSGYEALMRWNHPARGILPPSDFLGGLEESGLIVQVGSMLLEQTCRDAARWPVSMRVAVNLTAGQLLHREIVETIGQILARTGLAPSRLELEVTEDTIASDPAVISAVLRRLHGLGIRLVMDDFGIGRSSLGSLRSLPFDRVKIDRSFIRNAPHDLESRTIVRTVIRLCAELGIATTAVGIETEAQLELLAEGECDEVQGFLFGVPRPLADLFGAGHDNRIRHLAAPTADPTADHDATVG